MLEPPSFHHLHLNSVDPDAAIAFYAERFASTARADWNGIPALRSPTNVLVLFARVEAPPPTSPPTAFWHFGWHVQDTRATRDRFLGQPGVSLLPCKQVMVTAR